MNRKLETIAGPRDLAEVVAWLARGSIHAHPWEAARGLWRFSPWGDPPTVYLDRDPTELFGERHDVGTQSAWLSRNPCLYARLYSDGGGGVNVWDGKSFRHGAAIYQPLNKADGELRAWLMDNLP